MAIILGGVTLPAALKWADEFDSSAVIQSTRRTLDGGVVFYTSAAISGREITLSSGADHGWLTRTQANAIAALAAVPGAIYDLIIRGTTYSVAFRHDDAPAFSADPLFNYANPQSGDYYLATIKLITV